MTCFWRMMVSVRQNNFFFVIQKLQNIFFIKLFMSTKHKNRTLYQKSFFFLFLFIKAMDYLKKSQKKKWEANTFYKTFKASISHTLKIVEKIDSLFRDKTRFNDDLSKKWKKPFKIESGKCKYGKNSYLKVSRLFLCLQSYEWWELSSGLRLFLCFCVGLYGLSHDWMVAALFLKTRGKGVYLFQ